MSLKKKKKMDILTGIFIKHDSDAGVIGNSTMD